MTTAKKAISFTFSAALLLGLTASAHAGWQTFSWEHGCKADCGSEEDFFEGQTYFRTIYQPDAFFAEFTNTDGQTGATGGTTEIQGRATCANWNGSSTVARYTSWSGDEVETPMKGCPSSHPYINNGGSSGQCRIRVNTDYCD